jgi:hypothetical protein
MGASGRLHAAAQASNISDIIICKRIMIGEGIDHLRSVRYISLGVFFHRQDTECLKSCVFILK